MRSNTAGGGPSIDSKATVGPSLAIAKEAPGAPPLAQPPSAPAAASNSDYAAGAQQRPALPERNKG